MKNSAELYKINEMHDTLESEIKDKDIERKREKGDGLNFIRSHLQADNPRHIDALVDEAKQKYKQLFSGFFSRRTKVLLEDLTRCASKTKTVIM